jgi:DtxR family manganese transport transcriptional regulator
MAAKKATKKATTKSTTKSTTKAPIKAPIKAPRTPAVRAVKTATSAEHHRTLRKQHESEAAQDYCEVIAELLDSGVEARVGRIAERFGLSHVTVSRVVRRLASEGFVDARPHRPLRLTRTGEALAAEARARHEVVLAFLRALGVDERTAHADAEGIEHHVSPPTLRAMARFASK